MRLFATRERPLHVVFPGRHSFLAQTLLSPSATLFTSPVTTCSAYVPGYPSCSSCKCTRPLPSSLSALLEYSWLTPILRTNASPIYLILFISAAYFLNRPCIYCSLLLAILVIALFDFSAVSSGSWFEPRYEQHTRTQQGSNTPNATQDSAVALASSAVVSAMEQTASNIAAAINLTTGTAIDAIVGAGKRGMEESGSTWTSWIKRVWRSGLRIDCLGVTVRL